MVASAVGPRRGGGLAASVASAVASRLQTKGRRGPPGGSQLDVLASKLASAMTRRLASPGAASGPTLNAKRLTGGIASRVTRRLGGIQSGESPHVGTLDPQATAEAVTKILSERQARASDPAQAVASQVAARLHKVEVAGKPNEARDFQQRVASIVIERLRTEQQAQAADAKGSDADAGASKEAAGAAATAGSDSAASGGESATAAVRKRG